MIRLLPVFLCGLLLGASLHVLWTAARIGADSLLPAISAIVLALTWATWLLWRRARRRTPPRLPYQPIVPIPGDTQ